MIDEGANHQCRSQNGAVFVVRSVFVVFVLLLVPLLLIQFISSASSCLSWWRETTLLKREGGSASGERGKWYIRGGNHVTLVELFNYGCQLCPCHFLYTLYLRQPIFVARKRHSESKTPEAMLMRNAHRLHHHETGKWALPWNPW